MTSTLTRLSSPPASESFLVTDENRLAVSALDQLKGESSAGSARQRFPLVYLWGPAGVGKSHLIEQFVKTELAASADLAFAHLTASEFAARFADASNEKQIPAFQETFQELNLLICEDLHALSRRAETQSQLTAIVDQILSRGGRVVFSSQVSPRQLKQVSSRLINRCHGGICVGLTAPDQQGREALLSHFATARQLPLSLPAAELLADKFPVSPRELKAAITQLENWSRWKRRILDSAAVEEWLKGEPAPSPPTISRVAKATARHFGVSLAEIRSASRQQKLVLARQSAMYLVRELTEESLTEISRYFARKHHTTVLHACNRIPQLEETHPTLTRELNQIRESLK